MSATSVGPRAPIDAQEAFAWGYMIGYLGEPPEVMQEAFPSRYDWDPMSPTWFLGSLFDGRATAFRDGYRAGVSMYTDHAHPEDREEA